MESRINLDGLNNEIRQLYHSDSETAAGRIEQLLSQRLHFFSDQDKLAVINQLQGCFSDVNQKPSARQDGLETKLLGRISALLLGSEVIHSELTDGELQEKLTQSLNSVFNTLDKLISVINQTLGGGAGDQTLSQVIKGQLEGEASGQTLEQSLENYLGQIEKAFLTTSKAFKMAAREKVDQIFAELDPVRIAAEKGGGLKFGPLRKAELFNIYEEKYSKFKRWVDSGRFLEELERTFERNCRSIANK